MRFRPSILWSAFLTLSVMIGLSTPAGASSSSTVAPSTIDSTGTTDVTGKLLAFIASVPDGSTISFPAGARYRIESSLIIEGRKDLTFEGHGAEFFATTEADRNRRHWWIRNSDGITIRDVVVRGANPNAGMGDAAYRADREAQHGFDFAGTKNALLERVTVTDVYGDFVYIGLGKSSWSKNVIVRDSTFQRNGRQGIAITAGQDILIEHNLITDVRRTTFDIEPNGVDWGARRVTISENDIGPGRLNFISGHGYAAPVEDITVIGNRLKGKNMSISLKAPSTYRRTNFSLVGNVSDAPFGSPTAAVKVEGFDGVTIRDNVLPLQAGRSMTAVAFTTTCNTIVVGNTFANAARDVQSDGYDCTKETSPTTTLAAAAPAVGASPSTTAARSPAASAAPTSSRRAEVGTGSPATPSDAGTDVGKPDRGRVQAETKGKEEEKKEEAALPAATDDRLTDLPRADDDSGPDNAVWALVIGAVISLAVLIPLSHSGQRKRSSGT